MTEAATTEQPDKAKPKAEAKTPAKTPAKAPAKRKPIGQGGEIAALMPKDMDETWRMAEIYSNVPAFRKRFMPQEKPVGTPEQIWPVVNKMIAASIMAVIDVGGSVGLPPIVALQWVMEVNGKYCMWGDSQLALVKKSGELEEFKEEFFGEGPGANTDLATWPDDFGVKVTAKRKGEPPVSVEFTVADAKVAKLWNKGADAGKATPWVTAPKRMMKYRARAFCLRDVFSDVLLGLTHTVEELSPNTEPDEQTTVYDAAAEETPEPEPARETEVEAHELKDVVGETHGFYPPANFCDQLAVMLKAEPDAGQRQALWEMNVESLAEIKASLHREGTYDAVEAIYLQLQEAAKEASPEAETAEQPDTPAEAETPTEPDPQPEDATEKGDPTVTPEKAPPNTAEEDVAQAHAAEAPAETQPAMDLEQETPVPAYVFRAEGKDALFCAAAEEWAEHVIRAFEKATTLEGLNKIRGNNADSLKYAQQEGASIAVGDVYHAFGRCETKLKTGGVDDAKNTG